jgi:hypothetical protein
MKKNLFALIAGALIIILFLPFDSCHKIEELKLDLRNGNADLKQCVIKEIDFQFMSDNIPAGGPNQLIFTYNSQKDPVTMIPNVIGDGSPSRAFYYDKNGRLTSFVGILQNGAFEFWHDYTYDRLGRIIEDSLYIFGVVGNLGGALTKKYSALSYDHLNRVVREIITFNFTAPGLPDTINYSYDAAGNLYGAAIPYDNNVNPLLTNKIWRFLDRDYSVNNSVKATAFNEHRLPILYSNTTGGPEMGFFEYNITLETGITIQYDCMDALNAEIKKDE